MSLGTACVLISSLSVFGHKAVPPPDFTAALNQANLVAAKLTSRTERAIAFLVLAQAQDAVGDKPGALKSLNLGWDAYERGTDAAVSEGDQFDFQSLVDSGDISTLPVEYAVKYVEVGSMAGAKRAAHPLGSSPLAKVYLQDIGERIKARFPESVEMLAFTEEDQVKRAARKAALLASLDKVRAEPDITKRSFQLTQISEELTRTNGRAEALPILREGIDFAPKIEKPIWRVTFVAQCALSLWYQGAKDDAKALIVSIGELDKSLSGDPVQVLRAHYAVEQSKGVMGLPNTLAQVIKDIDAQSGVIAVKTETPPQTPDKNDPYFIISEATRLHEKGDDAGAKVLLKKLKLGQKEPMVNNGGFYVIAGDLQIQMNDMESARRNLAEGSRQLIASLKPRDFHPSEDESYLERIAQFQLKSGAKAQASKTLLDGIAKLSAGPTTKKIMHMGDKPDHWVLHDRKSPILHWGAEALARVGDYPDALAMAKSIEHPAHRAIALAGIVRDSMNLASKTTKANPAR